MEELTGEIKNDDDCLAAGWKLEADDLTCLSPVNKNRFAQYRNLHGFLPKFRKPLKTNYSPSYRVKSSVFFGSLIEQMRDKIEDKGLVPHDVYPDGNCLFSAIVDQLRVRGDFSFTSHSLRQSAVEYLKRNPATDDGTSLSMFLSDGETWESYLIRINQDGEWGDHIILRALANVIDEQITILGGTIGERETVVYPRSQTEKHDVLKTGQEIYLGHLCESHYISLRPKNWQQKFLLKHTGLQKGDILRKTALEGKMLIQFPVHHFNIILRYIFRKSLVQSYLSPLAESLTQMRYADSEYCTEGFGSFICKMVTYKSKQIGLGTGHSMKEEVEKDTEEAILTIFITPEDTAIPTSMLKSKSVDLLPERSEQTTVGHLKLSPCKPNLWHGQIISSATGQMFLKTNGTCCFDINICPFHTEISQKIINSHFMLAFRCSWPDIAGSWARRQRKFGFPDEQTVKIIVNNGCHVVPLTSCTKLSDLYDDPDYINKSVDDHTWFYSFVNAEKEISRILSSEQRQTFLVFKTFIDLILKDISLPVSIVKSVFFHACENIALSLWKSSPVECLLMLLKKLSLCMKCKRVPHYFMSEKNLLEHITEETTNECFKKLENAKIQPFLTLFVLRQQYTGISSVIDNFFEETMSYYALGNPGVKCFGQISFPENSREFCKDLIYDGNFQLAFLVIQDITETNGKCLHTDGVKHIAEILAEVGLGLSWCFTLFVDICHKTELTSELCKGHRCVSVTEVFGPDCVNELPETMIPECFSICKGNLIFLSDASVMLLQVVSPTMFIKCMKYYLKRYQKLAGESLILPDLEFGNAAVQAIMSTDLLERLHTLYVQLFNTCQSSLKLDEFREMMPTFLLIAETLGTTLSLRNIDVMQHALDSDGTYQRNREWFLKM